MLLERGLRLLQEISALGIPARYMGPLLVRLVPYYAQQALPFGFVVAVALVLSRMGRNREWEAMAGAGVSPARIARIMTLTATVVALATLLISGFLEPLGDDDAFAFNFGLTAVFGHLGYGVPEQQHHDDGADRDQEHESR